MALQKANKLADVPPWEPGVPLRDWIWLQHARSMRSAEVARPAPPEPMSPKHKQLPLRGETNYD